MRFRSTCLPFQIFDKMKEIYKKHGTFSMLSRIVVQWCPESWLTTCYNLNESSSAISMPTFFHWPDVISNTFHFRNSMDVKPSNKTFRSQARKWHWVWRESWHFLKLMGALKTRTSGVISWYDVWKHLFWNKVGKNSSSSTPQCEKSR